MLKIKEWLDNNNYHHTVSNILNAINLTKTKTMTIEMNTGRKFLIECTSHQFEYGVKNICLNHVFVDGLYYKEFVTINQDFISCIY